jgi:serine/threonine-protein kinase RsbW
MGTLDIEIYANLENLGVIADLLEKFMEEYHLDSKIKFGLQLSVDEVVSNIIEHGEVEGEINIRCSINEEKITIIIEDEGKEFNPNSRAPPDLHSDLEKREPGGLGIYFITHYTDEIIYEYEDQKNVLTLVKYLTNDN